jgi:hypothetical protein
MKTATNVNTVNFDTVYSKAERIDRDLLIAWNEGSDQSKLPLGWFLGKSATDRLERRNECWYDEETTPEGLPASPGLRKKDIADAILSRSAMCASLEVLADQLIFDPEEAWILDDIFPPTYRSAWKAPDLAALSRYESMAMFHRAIKGDPHVARSTAGEMLLHYVITQEHRGYLQEAGVEAPHFGLEEVMLEDEDFLFLFDPRWDGIETSPLAKSMGMTITGPGDWFKKFRE